MGKETPPGVGLPCEVLGGGIGLPRLEHLFDDLGEGKDTNHRRGQVNAAPQGADAEGHPGKAREGVPADDGDKQPQQRRQKALFGIISHHAGNYR